MLENCQKSPSTKDRPLSRLLFLIIIAIITVAGTTQAWDYGDAVINELMWMGTSFHQTDEFFEIRNMTGTPVNFAATSWSIYREGTFLMRIDEGELPPHGLFLICRRDSTNSRIIGADMVSSFLVLTNSNTAYTLYAGASDAAPLLDVADDGVGLPMSGRFIFSENVYWSMERNDPPGDGEDPENWHTACRTRGFIPGSFERGTPGFPNYRNIPPLLLDSITIIPETITDDSVVIATAYGVTDPDSVTGRLIAIFDWLAGDSLLFTTVDSVAPFESEFDSSHSIPGMKHVVRVFVFDGMDSSDAFYSDTIRIHFEVRDIVINEVAWAGSNRSEQDEWIELKNRTDRAIDLSRSPIMLTIIDFDTLSILLDSGIVAPDGYFLVSHFAPPNELCAFAVEPDLYSIDLGISDSDFEISIHDFPGEISQFIDRVNNTGPAFAGDDNSVDSIKYSMSRKHLPGNGSEPGNWFTSEVMDHYKPHSLERGSPRGPNRRNTPPTLCWTGEEGFETGAFDPDTGTMDTFFFWCIKYTDLDNEQPEFIDVYFDWDLDSTWDSLETYCLYHVDPSDTDYTDGAIFRRWMHGLRPTDIGGLYSIRANDGNVISTLGIPALEGPIVEPTIRFTIFGREWRPEIVYGPPYDEPFIVTKTEEMPILYHSGDTPLEVGLVLSQPDIYTHSADTFHFSPGGWDFAESPDSVGLNVYALSSLIVPSLEAPLAADFNDVTEDVLIDEIRWFDGDTLGRLSDGLDNEIQPGERLRLAFRLDLPTSTAGFYSEWVHRITVTLYVRPVMP